MATYGHCPVGAGRGIMQVMDTPPGFEPAAPIDDELDETDMTEDEFDARMAAGQPALVVGYVAKARLFDRVEDYYTVQVSGSSTLLTSGGQWGALPQSTGDHEASVLSAA